jgi:Tfp pilus assembly protein PilX
MSEEFVTVDLRRTLSRGDETGSMMLAMLAVLIVGGLTAIVAATIVQGQSSTRRDRDFTGAVHVAEAGAQEGLFRISGGFVTPSSTPAPVAGSVGGAAYSWTACPVTTAGACTASATGRWRVTSIGTLRGVDRIVELYAEQRNPFTTGLYAETKIHLTGSGEVRSYNGSTYSGSGTGRGRVQSGGSLQPAGMHSSIDEQIANTPLNLASAAEMKFIDDRLTACGAILPDWSSSQSLPAAVSTSPPTYCLNSATFNTNWTPPAGGVVLYVRNGVSFQSKRLVNCANCAGTSMPDPMPNSANLQIFSAGTSVTFQKGARVGGAIYAPRADCRGAQSMPDVRVYGSLVCGTVKTNGQFSLYYDERLGAVRTGTLRTTSWTEQ